MEQKKMNKQLRDDVEQAYSKLENGSSECTSQKGKEYYPCYCWRKVCDLHNSQEAGLPRCCFAVAMSLAGLLYVAWPTSMISIGVWLQRECPIEPMIARSLSATACAWLLVSLCLLLLSAQRPSWEARNATWGRLVWSPWCPVFVQWLLLIGFFIWSAVLVYPLFGIVQHAEDREANYCHPVLYYYAFASTTSMLVSSAVCLLVVAVTRAFAAAAGGATKINSCPEPSLCCHCCLRERLPADEDTG